MNIAIQDISDTRKSLTISFPPKEIQEEERSLVDEFSKQAQIPGYRPGKAPPDLIRNHYGKRIDKELERKMISKAYESVQKDSKLDIFALVNMENETVNPDQEGTVTFTVDIKPTFEVPEYEGIRTEVAQEEASSESEIDTAIDSILNQRAEYNVVERAAEKGDYVKLSYEGKIGDQPIADIAPDHAIYGRQSMTWEEAGVEEERGLPGVRAVVEGIVGMQASDKKSVSMDFAKDFEVSALAGKTATYEIEVLEVREKKLPELDEAFFKSLKVENLDALKEQVRKDIDYRKEQKKIEAQKAQVIDHILDKVDFPLPLSAVEHEKRQLLTEHVRYEKQRAPDQEVDTENTELVEKIEKTASKRIRLQLILDKIAELETIEVEDKELQNAIFHQAFAMQISPQDLVKKLRKDPERVAAIKSQLLMNKTLKFIVDQAVVAPLEENIQS